MQQQHRFENSASFHAGGAGRVTEGASNSMILELNNLSLSSESIHETPASG